MLLLNVYPFRRGSRRAIYRELIPVVEIDGERVCTYYVQPEPFRRKLAAAQAAGETAGL